VNSNEKIVRQYVREILISERKGRADVRRRGQEVGIGITPDVIGWLKDMKDMFGHFWNAIKGLVYTGTAAYKGAESVFKVGSEALQGVVGGKEPDYDSIITNQAATMRKMRDWTGIEQMPTLGQNLGLTSRTNESIDLSLKSMSLSFLLEQLAVQDAMLDDQAEGSAIVDAAVQDVSQEMSRIDSLGMPEPPEEASEDIPLPSLDPSRSQEISAEMSRAANADVQNVMNMYHQAVNSTTLQSTMNIVSRAMGRQDSGQSFTPEALSQRVSSLTGEAITPEDIDAGSQDLMRKIKGLIPSLFTGILGGSLDRVLSSVVSEPLEVQEAIKNAVMPSYNQALEIVKVNSHL